MPIYEYRCGACGHELEVLQKLSEPPLSECPQCNKQALSKLISPVGFQLKGSGWYATDFKGNGKTPSSEAKKEDGSAKSEPKSESSGESKPKSESGGESKATATAEASKPSGGCGGNCSCH